jgi:hypothetical protein
MNKENAAALGVLVLVFAGALALAVFVDPGSPDAGGAATTAPEAPATDSAATSRPGTPTAAPSPFGFEIVATEPCGQTCRDVTVELTNNRDTVATGVTVSTRIFAGNETTEGAMVWDGEEDVGRVAAGGTITSTRRVELGFSGGLAVQNSDGWVTIVTTVASDDTTVTFERTEQVA